MAIFLYTDFGSADLYVGQMKAVLHECAPAIAVIDLFHDAPAFNAKASAHLLASLSQRLPAGSVTVAVVDPGVGGTRPAVAVHADGRWYVGPDNGLLSVIADRASSVQFFSIQRQPPTLSASFHGRDLFAPVAARVASNAPVEGVLKEQPAGLATRFGAGDVAEIVYIDHFGNAMTGLRAANLPGDARLQVGRHALARARVYSDMAPAAPFWYENSLGLAEIAANQSNAARMLGLTVGQGVMVTETRRAKAAR